jgi:hypothetical protein
MPETTWGEPARVRMDRRTLAQAAGVFLFVLLVYVVSPNATPFDSRWVVHTATSLLHERNANLDEYLPLLERDEFYAIECVPRQGPRLYPIGSREHCPDGHYYNFYPIAVPLLAAPGVLALEAALALGRPVLAPLADRMSTDARRNLLRGDLIRSSMAVELILGSAITALGAALFFLLARSFLGVTAALMLAGLLAFGTPAWSTASRAMWMHGPSLTLHCLVLLLLVAGERKKIWIDVSAAVLALAFFVRPTNALLVIAATLFVAIHHRDRLARFVGWALPVTAGFVAINWSMYGAVLAPYMYVTRPNAPGLSMHPAFGEALAGQLISPSRGLLIYLPFVLFSIYGAILSLRRPNHPIDRYVAAIPIPHYLLISIYQDWSGGHSFGPRYFADIVPLFVYLLIPVLRRFGERPLTAGRRAAAAGLVVTGLFSVWVHARGALAWSTYEWNTIPAGLRSDPSRLWDWRDPQFLRGPRPGAATTRGRVPAGARAPVRPRPSGPEGDPKPVSPR